jgi:hypothetical protein
VVIIERRGNSNQDRVHFCDVRVVRGSSEPCCLCGLDLRSRDANDVRSALSQRVDFAFVDIESGHTKSLLAEKEHQGKTNIAESDDSHLCSPAIKFFVE